MSTETNQTEATTEQVVGEKVESKAETIAVSREEYEKLNQTLGSLKRELKDLKKPKEETADTSKSKSETEEFGLVHKTFLRSAGISDPKEVDLARELSKKWDMPIDALVDDEDFKARLEKHRTAEANALASSNIKGGAGTNQAKLSSEYWAAKGTPPTRADIPDRKTRAKIVRDMMATAGTNGKKFYND